MRCRICGAEFTPSGHGSPQRYCSVRCRNKAKVQARKAKTDGARPADADTAALHVSASGHMDVESGDLTRVEFHRMMDDSMEDVLRHNRDVLRKAMDDPDTPANALAAISRQLIAVCDRLDQIEGDDPLLDGGDSVTEMMDDGASII